MFYTIFVLNIDYNGSLWQGFVLLLALTFGSVSLGIFVSTFARNEFQVVQFIPLILAPQVFLSGVIVRVEQLPGYLQVISEALPLTYAVRGMQDIMVLGQNLRDVIPELAALVAFALVMMTLALLTVRKT
jgi:ABC-2 type transport system permease protein